MTTRSLGTRQVWNGTADIDDIRYLIASTSLLDNTCIILWYFNQ